MAIELYRRMPLVIKSDDCAYDTVGLGGQVVRRLSRKQKIRGSNPRRACIARVFTGQNQHVGRQLIVNKGLTSNPFNAFME